MYPVLSKLFVLVRQYEEPYLYQIYVEGDKSYYSGAYTTEIINKTACEILECCDGTKKIEEIADIFAKRYHENYDNVLNLVNDFIFDSVEKKTITLCETSQINNINVFGSYDIISPVNVTFEITKACPLRCKHCFNNSGESKENELSKDEIIDVLQKIKKLGVQKINLTGGEVMTRKDFINILRFCSNNFIAVAINSNGFYIDEEFVKNILEFRHNIMFQISLDGLEEKHNNIRGHKESFSRAINAVKILSSNKILVTVASTFNQDNICEIEEVTKLAKTLGAIQISYGKTLNLGRAKDNDTADSVDLVELGDTVKQLRIKYSDKSFFVLDPSEEEKITLDEVPSYCGAGVSQICIRENGDVSPCISLPYVYGNLLTQELNEIFGAKNTEVFKKLTRPGSYYCYECEDESICLGCNAVALEINNDNCSWRKANTLPISIITSMDHYE